MKIMFVPVGHDIPIYVHCAFSSEDEAKKWVGDNHRSRAYYEAYLFDSVEEFENIVQKMSDLHEVK